MCFLGKLRVECTALAIFDEMMKIVKCRSDVFLEHSSRNSLLQILRGRIYGSEFHEKCSFLAQTFSKLDVAIHVVQTF